MKSDVSYLTLTATCIVILSIHMLFLATVYFLSMMSTTQTLAPLGRLW